MSSGRVRVLTRTQLMSSSFFLYPAGAAGRVLFPYGFFLLLLSSFFFLPTLQRLISLTCLDRFWPNLVTGTPTLGDTWIHDLSGVRGHLGVTGSKVHFHKKCFFSYRLRCMVTWLMHMTELETLHKSYRMKFWSGVIKGALPAKLQKKSKIFKKSYFLHITWNDDVTFTHAWPLTSSCGVLTDLWSGVI